MFSDIFSNADKQDDRIERLKGNLVKFYAGNTDYYGHAEGGKDALYDAILQFLEAKYTNLQRPVRVLEFGAGRTSFPAYLDKHRRDLEIDFVAHDINDTNREFYETKGICHAIGDWSIIGEPATFDFCFSTYVYEHLAEPHIFLRSMIRLLSQDGSFVIICPKYIFPGYIPPAIRWLSWRSQQFLTFRLALSNLSTGLFKRPRFWICVEPAVFKLPWRRDYDAVHMVSTADLKAALSPHFKVSRLHIHGRTIKAGLLHRLTVLSVVAERSKSL